jgi:5-methylcytosine-specific restriction protein A
MTFIITWNKDKWPEAEMQALMDRHAGGEEVINRWKFGSHKKFGTGDRVFLSRTGKSFPGLIGSGRIVSEIPVSEPDIGDPKKFAWYVDIRFDYLSKTTTEIVASHMELADRLGVPKRVFTPQLSGQSYSKNGLELEDLWAALIGKAGIVYPDEAGLTEESQYLEGAKTKVTVNKYERDLNARKKCIEFHGSSCKACGIDFGLVYGPKLGKRYIHVHHIKPLKDIGEEYCVDPITDLVPLCPNCHAMVHQKEPPMPVAELKENILPRYRALFSKSL